MNSLFLAAMAAVSTPTDADMQAMFDKADAFVRVCQPALAVVDDPDLSDEQAAVGLMCSGFVTGVAYAKDAADAYSVKGNAICSGPTTPRQTMSAAFRIYNDLPEGKTLTSTELVLAGQMAAAPCR